ncbi:MAG: type II toxin-antitoxin system PemK/MazF family toxin [Armatimonadota bacterium]
MDGSFDEGDIVWLDFSPQSGREQAGKRPALVITPKIYNAKSGLMIVCPITTKVKGKPFEVVIPGDKKTQGAILTNHLKSIDWQTRNPIYVEQIPREVLIEVRAKLKALLRIP